MSRSAASPDPSYPPRGLRLAGAAFHMGFGRTKFLEMVADGRMPKPKRVDGVVVWDRLELEAAFADLPSDSAAEDPADISWEDVA